MPRPFPKKISQIKPTLTQVAQTSHFVVQFGGLSSSLKSYLRKRGMDYRFIGDNLSLLCNRASLPGSAIATADAIGHFHGVAEKMAHTRTFVQMEMEFYVDNAYRSLKFLEHWTEFIASGSDNIGANKLRSGYHFRMQYPDDYKCDETRIVKFERDYKRYIEYRFFGMFPVSVNAVPVSYEGSNLLKCSANFHFDRYVSGQTRSLNELIGNDNNKDGTNDSTSSKQANAAYGAFGSAGGLDLGLNLGIPRIPGPTGMFNSNMFDPDSTVLSFTQLANADFLDVKVK